MKEVIYASVKEWSLLRLSERALVSLLTFCGLRIAEAHNADMRDYGHAHGHRVLKVTHKGGKTARVALAPVLVRSRRLPRRPHQRSRLRLPRPDQPVRLPVRLRQARPTLPHRRSPRAGVTPHSLRHSYATESLRLGAALQDVQDALGHANPRTTRRYDRSWHNLDRSPNYLLAAALTTSDREQRTSPQDAPSPGFLPGGSYGNPPEREPTGARHAGASP